MPSRTRTQDTVAMVLDVRDRTGTYPSSRAVQQLTGVSANTAYEAIRLARVERNEPDPKGRVMREEAFAKAVDYATTYYREHGHMPTNAMTANAGRTSLASGINANFQVAHAQGVTTRRVRRATGTVTDSDRQAEVLRVYNALASVVPGATTNAVMTATGTLLQITKQRVHQILVLE